MSQSNPADFPFDPDALREKYRVEREKRLRSDANDQFIEMKDEYAHFTDDPWVESKIAREPIADAVNVAVIGGGFSGLLAAAHLHKEGVDGVRVIEKGGDFGGTWYWNRYPGVACDIESYIYLPLLEELEYVPTEKYSKGAEIFEHCRNIAKKYDLYRDVLFQTEVTDVRWDGDATRWVIRTDRGDEIRAHFVCLAQGYLQKPKLPGIPGVQSFRGKTFHTSRWDYSYTGGGERGNMAGLADKRVGIIGTGATAVQAVPHLGASAEHLYVFQRTPSSVDVRDNRPTDPEWAASLEPGWHEERMKNFQVLTAGGYAEEDLVNDGWTDIIRKILGLMLANDDPDLSPEAINETMEMADFVKMEEIRSRVDSIVRDPKTAESLKPWYRQFCKRPCFHDEYLQTFNRPNVTLVDTEGKGVERVTEKGVVVGGTEYELDCLIYATGFEVGTEYERRAGYELVGREGKNLTEKWKDGIRTMHGIHIHGFPNCFMMSINQAGFTVNFVQLFEQQARHIAWTIARAEERGVETLEATEQGERDWVDAVIGTSDRTREFGENCTPGYYNNEGQPPPAAAQNGFYFGGPTEFFQRLEKWRADGEMAGLELSQGPDSSGGEVR